MKDITEKPLCIHCKHHKAGGRGHHWCIRFASPILLVDKNPIYLGQTECLNERLGGLCGIEAKYFERK